MVLSGTITILLVICGLIGGEMGADSKESESIRG
ncbi:hypothetical protein SRABI84_05291 [Peribacillus simplex]|nr:hypothetical protein SRABI84_05291 [Peribacillus simplex]